jgi:predicted urease superfamily metal-dependent hydrolase
MKIPVIYNNDYTVYFENDLGFTIIHCDCARWTKKVKKILLEDFDKLMEIHRNDIYAIHEIGDEKHKKFLGIFKFEYLKDFVGFDGKLRQIFVRRT